MPTYEYSCRDCENSFDVIKSIANLDDTEACPSCYSLHTNRTISRTHFYGASDWDTSHYNHGLGMWCKSNKHAQREARNRGLLEVGNEPAAKMLEAQEKDLQKEEDQSFDRTWEKTEHFLKQEIGKS